MRDLGKPTRRVGRPKEDAIKKRILARLRTIPRSWWIKTHGNAYQDSGAPDILGCVRGHLFAIEVKRPGGRATKLQDHVLLMLSMAEATTGVVSDPNEAAQLIKDSLRTMTL